MNNEQLKNVIRKIIQILMAEDIVSTRQLADRLSISIKSMRNKIEQTNDFLINNGFGHIEKKPRVGIWLVVNASMQNDLVRFVNGQSEGVLANEGQDRMAYVLGTLLKLLPNEAVTTQQMADALYISLPTVLKVIKEVQEWLDVYDIRIVNERNRGYSLAYQEHAYRMAVKSYICDVAQPESVGMFFHTIDIQLIKKAILQVEDEWNYMFTDESFDEIVVYCCLAVQRRKISIPTNISNADIETLQHYNEYPFTIAIFKRIEDLLHIQISDDDIYFLATQIMCSKFMEFNRSQDVWDAIHTYDEKLLHFVDEVIETIGNVLQKNLSNDQRLRESLIFHLRPTIFRLRYGAPQTNSMLNFIKTEYKTVFRATWSISILFEKYYDVQITEDELAFIVLYIESALERKDKHYTVVFVSNFTRGYAELVTARIKKHIPEIEQVSIVGRHDFKIKDFKSVDLIISDQELNMEDPRIVVIANLLSDGGLQQLRSFMDEMNLPLHSSENPFSPICYPLFSPELIQVHGQASSKEDILKQLSDGLEAKGYVNTHFYESVIEREEATSTAIGNAVALPHGAQTCVNESHVAIAILDTPVQWDDEEMVDVVFLLAFQLSTHEEIQRVQTFYKEYISLIETDHKVEQLRQATTNIELYKYLIR